MNLIRSFTSGAPHSITCTERRVAARGLGAAFAAVLLSGGFLYSTDEFLPDEPSPWDTSLNVRAGFGYKDNVALSPTNRDQSSFVLSAVDLAVFRLPFDGKQFTLFVSGEDIRFLETRDIKYEQYLAAVAEFKTDFSPNWNASTLFQYIYQHQIFDVSTFEETIGPVLVQGHRLALWPATLRRNFNKGVWLQAEPRLARQFFKQPLDDYWEPGGKISFGRDYGFRSTISLGYEIKQLIFDTRERVARDGTPIAGDLEYTQHDAELLLRHNWDSKRRWRTTTRLSFQANADNGSGFYDYDRYQVSQQAGYYSPAWELKASAKASYYDFAIQPATRSDDAPREKTLLTFSLRADRKFLKRLKVFAELEHERSLSNRPGDEYRVNKVLGGIDFEL